MLDEGMRTLLASAVSGFGLLALLACGGSTDAGEPTAPRVPKVHRATADACDDVRGATAPSTGSGACTRDADCTEGRNGRCWGGRGGPTCNYDECVNDSECPATAACSCGTADAPNVCVQSGCRVDADCGADGYCSPSLSSCGQGYGATYECHAAADECVDDADCDAGDCRFNATVGHWACSSDQCVGLRDTGTSLSGLACHVAPSTQRRL